MGKITENEIERYAIEELKNLGFQFRHGPITQADEWRNEGEGVWIVIYEAV